MRRLIPVGIWCAVTPMAILEYKYNRSCDELLANVLKEDFLTYEINPFPADKNIYQHQLEDIRKSSQRIKHWQSSSPVQQLFTSVPKRWT
jgi:hypothetical protein